MKKFNMWIGRTKINDQLLTIEQAENLAFEYEDDGYDNVIIEEVN